jgi:hypothetical protein
MWFVELHLRRTFFSWWTTKCLISFNFFHLTFWDVWQRIIAVEERHNHQPPSQQCQKIVVCFLKYLLFIHVQILSHNFQPDLSRPSQLLQQIQSQERFIP